jgi:hypothetical protein
MLGARVLSVPDAPDRWLPFANSRWLKQAGHEPRGIYQYYKEPAQVPQT